MFTGLSLRLRVFLFFALLGMGGLTLVFGALFAGHSRALTTEITNGFVFAGIISGFGLLALVAGIWLLFDENVAKPIERISAELRSRAHAGVSGALTPDEARYLGDLAPAANALSQALADHAGLADEQIAAETRRIEAEKARLTALLTEIPVATLMISPDGQIVLYDGQAAEVLATQGIPRLNAPLSDYLDKPALNSALSRMAKTGKDLRVTVQGRDNRQSYDLHMSPMADGCALVVIDAAHIDIAPDAARPLTYDFALTTGAHSHTLDQMPLSALTFTVFDTETTGLLPHKDEIVQIGAVRVLNGRRVPGEQIDQLVNPGIPIPPASTKVHKVSDTMVKDAPDIGAAGRAFHEFATGSVIVAHNAPFDMAFLNRHKRKMDVEWDHPILDTVLLSAVLFGASQPHTLDALCDRLQVTLPEHLRHTALGDAQATADVLVKMLPMLQARGLTTLPEVLNETRQHGRLLQDLN